MPKRRSFARKLLVKAFDDGLDRSKMGPISERPPDYLSVSIVWMRAGVSPWRQGGHLASEAPMGLRRRPRVKPYHLCYGRLGCAAPLVIISKTTITLVSAAVPRTRLSNGIFCDIAHPPVGHRITTRNSNIRFNMDASREYEITSNFPVLRFFGHSAGLDRR